MSKRFTAGLVLALLSPILLAGQSKEKKTYELIYQDIQLLKLQLQALDKKVQQNRDDIFAIQKQLTEILNLARLSRTEQAKLVAEQEKLPIQYLNILEKFETLSSDLARISQRLMELERAAAAPPSESETEDQAEQPPTPPDKAEETTQEKTEETTEAAAEGTTEPPASVLPANLSAKEVYDMALQDYRRGNFQLAIDGFSIYRDHFSESPLADNAVYWIGECYYSQGKWEEAIAQCNDLILNYPQGDKVPDAYLKKGMSLMKQDKKEEALAVFKILISKYPLEDATAIARQKIKEMGY